MRHVYSSLRAIALNLNLRRKLNRPRPLRSRRTSSCLEGGTQIYRHASNGVSAGKVCSTVVGRHTWSVIRYYGECRGMDSQQNLHWKIDECAVYFDRMRVRGWCFHPAKPIAAVAIRFDAPGEILPLRSFGTSSPDIAAVFGSEAGRAARFDEWVSGSAFLGTPFSLIVTYADGSGEIGVDGLTNAAWGDPYFQSWENFIAALGKFEGGTVLEIGSRARSGISRKHRIPSQLDYIGLDILAGPNVDIVGDAHELNTLFPKQKFVAAFSTSVFEHLLMPWKVTVELNHVLHPGAIVYTSTHQTWPIHEEPWDFWRYSRYSWDGIFNPPTGFEILEAVMGEPARVHPFRTSEVTRDMPGSPAFLGSACLAKKVSTATVDWPNPRSFGFRGMYPAGELSASPTRDHT